MWKLVTRTLWGEEKKSSKGRCVRGEARGYVETKQTKNGGTVVIFQRRTSLK